MIGECVAGTITAVMAFAVRRVRHALAVDVLIATVRPLSGRAQCGDIWSAPFTEDALGDTV